MKAYLVTITMLDGSRGRHHGLYDSACTAIVCALQAFPDALRIAARPHEGACQ